MNISWRPWTSGSSPRRRPGGTALVLAGFVAAATALVPPAEAPAQEKRVVDSGTFRILEDGTHVATEQFAIRREAETFQSAARLRPAGMDATASSRMVEFRLQLNADLQPTFFELTNRGPGGHGVVGVRSGNRLQLRSRSKEGERWQEFLLEPGIVVVPKGLAHPYYFVARVLDSGRETPIPVVAPDAGARRSLTVESRSTETLTVGGEQLGATLRVLRIDGRIHRVWTDDAGRVLRVEVPDRGWSAVRSEPPEAAEAGAES